MHPFDRCRASRWSRLLPSSWASRPAAAPARLALGRRMDQDARSAEPGRGPEDPGGRGRPEGQDRATIVADIGAGTGAVHASARASRRAGRNGAYAVEVDKACSITSPEGAPSSRSPTCSRRTRQFDDPNPAGRRADLAFIHDVLHHIEDRADVFEEPGAYLKPAGRIAVIDFHPGKGRAPRAAGAAGQQGAGSEVDGGGRPRAGGGVRLFEDKYFVVFARNDQAGFSTDSTSNWRLGTRRELTPTCRIMSSARGRSVDSRSGQLTPVPPEAAVSVRVLREILLVIVLGVVELAAPEGSRS